MNTLCMIDVRSKLEFIASDIEALLSAPAVLLGTANPPSTSGVYALSVADLIVYIGEAKGSKGLRDRLLRKHISGDDNHSIQRAFLNDYPDRILRCEHIKKTVSARWIEIPDLGRVSVVERTLIWLLNPEWNRT